jgi:hypothetical protein
MTSIRPVEAAANAGILHYPEAAPADATASPGAAHLLEGSPKFRTERADVMASARLTCGSGLRFRAAGCREIPVYANAIKLVQRRDVI